MNVKGETKKTSIRGMKTNHQIASKTPPIEMDQNSSYDLDNYQKPAMKASDVAEAIERKGMVLPFIPLTMTFDNIRYSVDMPVVRFCVQ